MTNKVALGIFMAVVLLFVVDRIAFGGTLPVFLGKKLIEFTEWLAFWR